MVWQKLLDDNWPKAHAWIIHRIQWRIIVLDVLKKVLRAGFKTSEFWVAILAVMAPVVLSLLDKAFGLAQGTLGGPETFAGGLVAAVYVYTRGKIKEKAAGAVITDTGNKVGAGLGSAAAEAEFARAARPLSER